MSVKGLLREYADMDKPAQEVTALVMKELDPKELKTLVAYLIREEIDHIRRGRVRAKEKLARARMKRELDKEAKKQGFKSHRQKVVQRGQAAEKVIRASLRFTEDFLNEMFAVGNTGRRVAWGDATVQDHETRIHWLEEQKSGIEETRQIHLAVVQILREVNASCLRELEASEVVSSGQ